MGKFVEIHIFCFFFCLLLHHVAVRISLPFMIFVVIGAPGGVGGHSLICLIRVCAAEKGIVFRVLGLKKGLNRVSF